MRGTSGLTHWHALGLLLALMGGMAPAPRAQGAAASQKERTKVAEGGYSDGDSWVLWRSSRGYLVEIEMKFPTAEFKETRQSEIIEFANPFEMKSFRYEAKKFPGLPDGALECTVAEQMLNCVSTFAKEEGRGTIVVGKPGAIGAQFGVHIALLDLPWFFTTLLAHESAQPPPNSTAWVIPVAFDGPAPDRLITGNVNQAEIAYLGLQQLTILGKQVAARKYQLKAHTYDSTLWTAANGVLLAAEWGGMRFELSRYKQYEEFTPELVGALEQAQPKRATRRFSN